MTQATKTRIPQYLLLLLWVTLVLIELTVPVQSQGCAPPLVTPGYMNPITITQGSWRPAIGNVTVKIDSNFANFTSDASLRIEEGQRKWNSPATCAGVNFTNFQDVTFTAQDLLSPAPFGEVHWEVDTPSNGFNGETISHIGFGGRVESATIKITPNLAVGNTVYFNYLGSHEIGHTFNLQDCLSTSTPACSTGGQTIMGGHTNTVFDTQGPTACDFAAVANIYCPPSPTPTPTPTPTPPPNNEEDCDAINWYWNPFTDVCQEEAPPPCNSEPVICEFGTWSFLWCDCIDLVSPIIVDTSGKALPQNSQIDSPFEANKVSAPKSKMTVWNCFRGSRACNIRKAQTVCVSLGWRTAQTS